MIKQSSGKIFLSGERGHTETNWFRSFNTFNFGGYQNTNKRPFGPLYVLNDDTLGGGKSIKLSVEEDSLIFLLPTIGTIEYEDSLGNKSFLEAGQAQIIWALKGAILEIKNPYENELINFLQLWFKNFEVSHEPALSSAFDLEEKKNTLVPIFDTEKTAYNTSLYLGKFDERKELVYATHSSNMGLFFFVLEGAFEVQNRLLEARDGLALWNLQEAEIEALSNEALMLMVELPLQQALKNAIL